MKVNLLFRYIYLLSLFILVSCSGNNKEQKKENVQQVIPETATEVTVMKLEKKPFTRELVSNGKLYSGKMADVRFQSSNRITKIYVVNGDKVKKGQIIASLDNFILKNNLAQAKDDLERSKLDLQDKLIGQGYKSQDTASVPENILNLMKIKSGYSRAQNNYKMAKFKFDNTILRAPIDGIVANLKSKENTFANPSEPFCNIIDISRMEVSFLILENEINMISKGSTIVVTPFSMPEEKIRGIITEINPWVDNNGMIRIKGLLNPNKKVVEGMNVRVSMFKSMEKQWVVPKTAVVLRTGRQVIFTKQGNKAMWNYVTTGLENATEYTITGKEKLNEGDTVIISGNINLAHESPIKVID